ncbi:MAG: family 1 glycosylhydrolase [Spirochaetaceae bacterium]|jgi:beta-glucosidase|nr:family 1 glycosylhydrolase [Spirochaetaceae bacterium]
MDRGFKLKDGMKIGAASAASQIEGAGVEHTWTAWADRGAIKDGSDPRRANDHYRRWKEDADLMGSLGFTIVRLGVEWARIEPEPGVFREDVLDHYREETALLRSYGLEPLVTLHHFAEPLWFARRGGFERPENLPLFLEFAEKTVRALGSAVDEYVTINEPNVYAFFGYVTGEWPPGERSFARALRVMSILAGAHILAYELIHRVRKEMGLSGTKVGAAIHARVFEPLNRANPAHRFFAWFNDRCFQDAISRALFTGRFAWPFSRPAGTRLPAGSRFSDFIGLNYYTRSAVSGPENSTFPHVPVNDLGWEIYPQGIVHCAERLRRLAPLPVYITENGTCDGTDSFRSRYIYDHLKALCESAVPVERYYHWCFCDNFEWLEGESARFGLVHVDYPSQKRSVKKSGRFLSAVSRAGGVDEGLYGDYVAGEEYPTAPAGR